MDRVARLSVKDRSALFSETAAERSTTPAVIEKDFWVTWVLERLFQEPELSQLLIFKGGEVVDKITGFKPRAVLEKHLESLLA